jgi:hypothetical protein
MTANALQEAITLNNLAFLTGAYLSDIKADLYSIEQDCQLSDPSLNNGQDDPGATSSVLAPWLSEVIPHGHGLSFTNTTCSISPLDNAPYPKIHQVGFFTCFPDSVTDITFYTSG